MNAPIHDKLRNEFRRVFGTVSGNNAGIGLASDFWPSFVRYEPYKACAVLRQFDDFYGMDEAGDSKVCAALEAAGAVYR